MSGIVGALGYLGPQSELTMIQRLQHRGSNHDVLKLQSGGYLAAISDVQNIAVCARNGFAATVAGDILCRKTIAESTEFDNLSFETCSTAEFVLCVYLDKGLAGVEKIVGNLAFAIVNLESGEALLGRDFFGVMPLFYARTNCGSLIFSSEYKAFIGIDEFFPRADRNMIQYLQYAKKLPVGRTLFENIEAVPPGSVLRFSPSGQVSVAASFEPLSVDIETRSESDTLDLLRSALIQSLRRCSGGDGSIGLALSGGIDSIGLAFLLRNLYPHREILTFSAGSYDNDVELRTAATVAKLIGSVHHEVMTPPETVRSVIRDVIWHLEDPYARSEVAQLFEIGRKARGHVEFLLTGQGADSLFGGMPRYRLLWLIKKLPLLHSPLEEFYNRTQYGITPSGFIGRILAALFYRGRSASVPTVRGASYAPEPYSLPRKDRNLINTIMATGFQVGQSVDAMKYERSFAAFGIGYRIPFADPEFVRFAYTIADDFKIRLRTNKYILRRAFEGIVPDQFLTIPKHAQRATCDTAFSDMLDDLKDNIFSERNRAKHGLFDCNEIQSMFTRAVDRPYTDEVSMRLWTAIATEIWAELFQAVERRE